MVTNTDYLLRFSSEIWAMQQESFRRRLVQTALRLTEDTPMAAGAYERQLLEQFVLGQLSIEEVVALVESATAAPVASQRQAA